MKNILYLLSLSFCCLILVQCSSDSCPPCGKFIQQAEDAEKGDYATIIGAYNAAYNIATDCDKSSLEAIHNSKQKNKDLANLQKLELTSSSFSSQNLKKETFVGLDNLQELHIQSLMLLSIDKEAFAPLKKLQKLSLAETHLSQLDKEVFKGLQQLQSLNLQTFSLVNLDKDIFKGLSNLQYLNLGFNKLFDFDKAIFSELSNLKELILIMNKLSLLDKDIFKGLNQLQKLDLAQNRLTYLDKDIFKGLSQLQTLDLSGNPLTNLDKDIFKGLEQLQRLSLPDINLDKDVFKGLNQLKILDGVCNIGAGSLNNLPALELLNLQYCSDFKQFPNEITELKKLRYVFVYETGLSAAEIARAQKLVPWAKIITEKDERWDKK